MTKTGYTTAEEPTPDHPTTFFFGDTVRLANVDVKASLAVNYFEKVFDDGTKVLLTFGNGILSRKDDFSPMEFSVVCSPGSKDDFRSCFQILR